MNGSFAALRMTLEGKLFLLRSGFVGEVLRLPLVPAAEERGRVLHTVIIEVQHRTGACVLVHSSTVGDDHRLGRNLLETLNQLATRDAQRTFDMTLLVRFLRADIDEYGLVVLYQFRRFILRDPAR